ncbi:TPA: N-acetylglucosamine-6-phosphate deacetylase [Candidatus Poribacteria bacterium]|nr:N-acetylglucosamine-6-phosphate deacetylase [Candidatus Poribacteria bacterium]HIC02609.1 N-acetylglucosamine-6-phosphate deacetylase [Candidatus Poribacteria bacterium]HIC19048.1 N-acetylglucosamine-6-phosphate deacetylase [Candidatus Poribacteria bacterium]HIO49878.1 N-acetylglucosamine-6-phosphate deacetylase [Candidatus Poribacteria bacterium]
MHINGWLVGLKQHVEIEMADGVFSTITKVKESSLNHQDVCIAPPLIDIQVNGFAGYDLNSDDVKTADVCQMVKSLWKTGTGFCCPTVVTGSNQRMSKSIQVITAALKDPTINRSIIGIHVEGPYISPQDGPRGAHPKEHVRQPNWDEFQRWQDIAEGQIKILTLAPETEGAITLIEKLRESGVVVAIGHTGAEHQQIQDAIQAGATMSTHLGNGAHAQIRRHPNYIWDQLAADELHASFIVDGHHLPPSVVKSMFRAKGLERAILVSDAVHLAGLEPGRYQFGSQDIELTSNQSVRLYGTDYLAGSAIELARGVENSVKFAEISLDQAFRLATVQPAGVLGLDNQIGSIQVGRNADYITFQWDKLGYKIKVLSTVIDGQNRN